MLLFFLVEKTLLQRFGRSHVQTFTAGSGCLGFRLEVSHFKHLTGIIVFLR
jgi:hypothetical protein